MYKIDPYRADLPTMYDLPSEDPEEPGLPDEFHGFQPQLLRETFQCSTYPSDEIFIGTDINLYYDVQHTLWHKRPDWFVVLGVPRAARQESLRWSYVIWQERVSPFLVLELLSPGTEFEDLGKTLREANQPPTKWEVYERILRIPYYAIFDRYINHLRVFRLVDTQYQKVDLQEQRLWLDEAQIGIGVWQGVYAGAEGNWLRCYNASGHWIPTPTESAGIAKRRATQEQQRADQESQRADQESQRADQESQRAERLAARLRELGINPEEV